MTYKYFEHKADIGIEGIGYTLEESFEEGAKAMFNVMVDINKIKPSTKIQIKVKASNDEELFVEFLNMLLTEADINDMVFCDFYIKERKGNEIVAIARGEKLDPVKHVAKTIVKAATYSQLSIKKEKELFISKCILDV